MRSILCQRYKIDSRFENGVDLSKHYSVADFDDFLICCREHDSTNFSLYIVLFCVIVGRP